MRSNAGPRLELPTADVAETDRLETAAMQLAKSHVYQAMETIVHTAIGDGESVTLSRLRYDAATQIVNRVLGPIKGPAGDWVEDWLKDIRNTPVIERTE